MITNYKNESYKVECDAWIDNKGTNGEVGWHAYATKENKKYLITWYTSEKWNKSNELLNIENRIQDGYMTQEETNELELRMLELEAENINSIYATDTANACDWDNADEVYETER